MYTYGFASDDNVDDAVAVRMSVRASVSKGTSNTYYIKSDGLSGVPQVHIMHLHGMDVHVVILYLSLIVVYTTLE